MKLDLSFLIEEEGKAKALTTSYDLDSIRFGSSVYPKTSFDELVLSFYNDEGKKLYVSGSTKAGFTACCDRCLEPVEITIAIHISEEFDIRDEMILYNEDDDAILIEDNILDVDRLVSNEILLNWPVKILCKEDCKGICPKCGQNLNVVSCDCDTVVLDPRMQQFQDVFKDFKEV